MKYTLAPSACRDLDEIWDYIARDNVEAADKILKQLGEKFSLLAAHKFLGRREESFGEGVRAIPHDSYLILYRSNRDPIEIVRVLHSARDIPTVMENDLSN